MPRSSSRRRSRSRRRQSPDRRRRSPSRRRSRSRRRSPSRRRSRSRQQSPRRRHAPSPQMRRSRSASFTPEWRRKGPASKDTDEARPDSERTDGDSSDISAAVVDGIPRSSGESTYRAEVNVPRENGSGPLGKRGLTAIRGPNRVDKGKAKADLEKLVDAFKRGGAAEVRKEQKDLNRSWVN
eukprot:TRINITY_DN106516_c0_g1_i1.p1 TRINITY_DN106516_c0_g1~~TRINITY_DN106516_c0_g1_i1.p1  ORF type:complete len:182 (-),score=12.58 TRINITY_DN106516_c0_g1_i1:41-586(-)